MKLLLSIMMLCLPALTYAGGGVPVGKQAPTPKGASGVKQDVKVVREKVESDLAKVTPANDSALQQRLARQREAINPFGISLFKPTYILPFYYTGTPDQDVGPTPDGQRIENAEFKGQFSIMFPLIKHLFSKKLSLKVAYTQLSYWQVYAKSQFFRETNYEPQGFISYHFLPNWLVDMGFIHQSNGRGGAFERSWNRAYINLSFSGKHWLVSIKPWLLIFKPQSVNLHNPDIRRFLGNGRILFAFKVWRQVFSIMLRNTAQSGFKRGAETVTWSFPLIGHLRGYIQGFSGYGQSLIEYNHYTNSIGFGLALNDWIQ